MQAHLASTPWDPEEFTPADHAAVEGAWSWLGTVAGKALEGGPDGQVDDELAYVAPWGFDLGQVRAPALFLHGGQDRVAPVSHGRWLAERTPSAELWLRPDDGHISVLNSATAALAGSASTPEAVAVQRRRRSCATPPGRAQPVPSWCSWLLSGLSLVVGSACACLVAAAPPRPAQPVQPVHRSAGRPGPRTGGRSRCRKARSPLVVGMLVAFSARDDDQEGVGEHGQVTHRYQERQRRTWCSSRPHSPLVAWKASSTPSGTRPPTPGRPTAVWPGRRSGTRPALRCAGCAG
jgi:hypothetical protein